MHILLPLRKQGIIQLAIAVICSIQLHAQAPVAAFTASVTDGCAPLQVSLTNASTGVISCQWVFGNSNSSTLLNPSTVYNNPGTYTITLIVTGTGGQKDTATAAINVVSDPIADFTAVINGQCAGTNTVQFTNTSQFSASYIWDFGDGSTSNAINPAHTYTIAGTFAVKLIAVSQYGCQGLVTKNSFVTIHPLPVIAFSTSVTSSCSITTPFNFTSSGNNISVWNWNFGDGTTSSVQNPVHQYSATGTYPVSLIVTSSLGCSDTLIKPNYITIGNSLVPSFTMNDSAGCGPLTINFTSTVPNATSWTWNFGDGTTSVTPNTSHTYTTPGNYTISLAVTTQSGCNGSVSYPNLVTVDGLPTGNFTVSNDSGCAPYGAVFTFTGSGASTYNWTFGNGSAGTGNPVTANYTNAGVYNVSVTAVSANGCTASTTVNNAVTVLKPAGNFIATPRAGCPGTTVQFTHSGSAANIVSWQWNFGDGTSSTLQNPIKTYNTIGNYNVFLVVTNSFGCKDTSYRGSYIKITSGAVAYTPPDTIMVCQAGSVTLLDPSTGSNSWNWNFGNGTTSTLQNPAVTYNTPGFYTVTLTTSMPGGCSQTFNPFAIIQVIPYSPFPVQINTTTTCKPYGVTFNIATPNINVYAWDFGDGSTSSQASPLHYYANAGTYTVTLTMTVGAGCIETAATTVTVGHANPILASQTDACINTTVNFTCTNASAFNYMNWNFGNALVAGGSNVATSYSSAGNYTVQLITVDTAGCRDTFPLSITISDPIAAFSNNPVHVCLGNAVSFSNLSQNSSSWSWDFGDGITDTTFAPSHTYAAAGTYTVVLSATENTCTHTVTLPAAVSVEDPQVNFTAIPNGQCLPVTVSYTSTTPGAVSWLWHFGDGDTSILANPVHQFNTGPAGPVILTVTDMYGCNKSVSQANINYFAASASSSSAGGCAPLTISFTDLSQQAIAWFWDFGDGTTSSQQNPSHTYISDGIYSVMLVCTFPGNCTDTILYNGMITINTPDADFFTPTQAGCSPSQISFVNQSNDASTYLWNFGDGTTSANLNPDHIYNIPGVYTITLVATNASGCVDSLVRPDYISIPGTYTQFSLSGISNCQDSEVSFNDSSINASVWAWDFGDGNIGNTQNPVHVYQDTGSYIVTLITQDSIGCSSSYTYPMSLVINPVPRASGYSSILSGCEPLPLQFNNTSNGALSYQWELGDGTTSVLDSPPHIYTTAGNYIPRLIATNNYGCKDTFDLAPIEVLPTPLPAFTSDTIWGCVGSTIQFNDLTMNASNPTWYWDFGFTNSTVQNPAITFVTPGIYNVIFTITSDNGCTNTVSQNAYIEIFDSIPPSETPVYSVSVVDDTSIDITFENLPVKDFGKYSIYRYNASTSAYQLIQVLNRNTINLANTLTYRDTGLDTKNNSYTYRIQTTDLCDYELPFNNLEEYSSINVTAVTASTNLYVSWTPYTGCTFSEYEIYRRQEPNGTFQLIGTVDSSTLEFLDTTLYCPYVYTYRILAKSLCGRNYSAWSDTSSARPENPMANQQVELTKTTVINNKQTLTEWQPPAILPNRVSAYMVLRGIDGNTAAPYTLLPAFATSYMDDSVDINAHSYSYFIISVNDCDLQGIISREGKSILLDGFWSNYQTFLKWTPYEKWPSGVQQYIIEKLQDDGSWLPVKSTFGTETNTVLDE